MSAKREPMLRLDKVDPKKVRVLELFRTERARLVREAVEFRAGVEAKALEARPMRRWAAGLGLAAMFAVATWGATRLAHAAPSSETPELVVSFKLAGKTADKCRKPTEAELAKLPMHMRPKQICERRRSNVRMKVFVDGAELVDKSYEPHGVWHDGNSVAIERIPSTRGVHDVRVEIGDTHELGEYDYRDERKLTLEPRRRAVVLFDKLDGFRWYE
ncbi:MAG: hypothetical protein IPI67_23170 [Myxococcales bacterium]|nr:hypothetical protein [Myxococcales bacterium]